MINFQRPETVICTAEVENPDSVIAPLGSGGHTLTDPVTSIKITITNSAGTAVVTAQAMSKDSAGLYHYDYNPAVDAVLGSYITKVIVVDGTRTTIQVGGFILCI
jgi:hypothetical protein